MATFPQPRSLSGYLLETQLLLLGPIMAAISEANQLQILMVRTSSWTAARTTMSFLVLPDSSWSNPNAFIFYLLTVARFS